MATWIKAGFWEKLCKPCKGYKGWLNLDEFVKSIIGNNSYSREVLSFPVPTLNDTIFIEPTAIDTIVVFEGPLTNDFTINVSGSSSIPGNRMYIFLEGSGPTVTFTGDITTTQCGGSNNQYSPEDPVCLEEIFNGNLFIGVDNC